MVRTMKFKNKRTGKIIEEHLLYYVNKYKNNPDYEVVKEKTAKKETKNDKEEVEDKSAS